ncbi:hypothetical protein DPX16_2166 [Anabarilius grahami]|uniref:Uncharacterized protein n=1 Tax=Anabarilius grahami TaxID=495550 RepID=A0A3N0YEW9_ANAGA|nr:hypothetical protein DPX16_2166 [Anabarilius grahami]
MNKDAGGALLSNGGGKSKKNDQESGLDQPSDSTEVVEPDQLSEEADPPNRAVLAAIAALRNEMTQIKDDICAIIDVRIQTVYTVLRGELATTTATTLLER